MSLTHLNAKLDSIRAEASRVWKEHTEEAAFVRQNSDLTEQAKRQHIEDSRQRAKEELKRLEQSEYAEIEAKKRSADRAIHATAGHDSSDIISFRDAQDRAEQLEDASEANRVLERAIASGDTTLATAVMRRALSQGWQAIYEKFNAEYPRVAEHVEDLAQIARYEASTYTVFDRGVYWLAN